MKKLILLLAAGLILAGTAFAKDENGALGFGIISDSTETGLVGGGIRGALFLDVGYQLTGPLFYGFELLGDLKQMKQTKDSFQSTDATLFINSYSWSLFITQTYWDLTVTRWDADISPRGYISFDVGNKIQLLGFGGFNYNWNTIDYTFKNNSSVSAYVPGYSSAEYYLLPGQSVTNSKALDGVWDFVVGARGTIGAFYIDYTRFLKPSESGDYSWYRSSKNRLGFGINLRF